MPLDPELLQNAKNAYARVQASAANVAGAAEVEREIDSQWEPHSTLPPEADDDWSYLGEAGRAVWGAVVDATSETALFLTEIGATMGRSSAESELRATNAFSEEQIQEMLAGTDRGVKEGVAQIRGAVDVVAPDNKTIGGNVARGVGQFLVPFLGWSKFVRVAGVENLAAQGMVAGFATDISAFDPNQGNLSNLLREHAGLRDPVTEFLATSPDDDAALNRLRNGIEGLGLGVATEGFIRVMKVGRARWAEHRRNQARADVNLEKDVPLQSSPTIAKVETPEQAGQQPVVDDMNRMNFGLNEDGTAKSEGIFKMNITDNDGNVVGELGGATRGGDTIQVTNVAINEGARGQGLGVQAYENLLAQAAQRGMRVVSDTQVSADAARVYAALERRGHKVTRNAVEEADDVAPGTLASTDGKPVFEVEPKAPEAPKPVTTGSGIEVPTVSMRDTLRATLQITPEKRQALIDAIENEDYSKAGELIDFNADTIDWSAMDEGDNLRQLLNTFSEIIAENITKAKGGVQTLRQTQRLANLVGVSAEQTHKLFADVRGNRGIAARMLAAERTMLASGQRLQQLAEQAKHADAAGEAAAKMELHRHIELHAALIAEVKGSKTEIARALNAMRIMKAASAESFREFDNVRRLMGGGHKNTDAVIDAVLQNRGLAGLNAVVIKTTGRKWWDAVTEIVINGLLSQPKTHLINISSNIVNTALYTADRYVAGLTHGNAALVHEANAATLARVSSLMDAFRLAGRAWREGKPITDVKQRLEFDTRKAITHELVGLENADTALAKTINLFGSAIRLPGRFLMAGDEFFKVVNLRGETAALSYRQAAQEAKAKGLTGQRYSAFVAKRQAEMAASPPPVIAAKAIEAARRVTFQESPRTTFGQNMERFVNASPLFKLIVAPFFRTPMNILRQALVDRTPFSLVMDETRKSLAAGGEEAAIARARVITGMGGFMTGLMLVSGGGPDKPWEIVGKRPFGNTAAEDHVLDYSIRIGDTWYQFNRLDPIGTWIGMSADFRDHMQLEYDPNDPESASQLFTMGQGVFGAVLNNSLNKSWFTSVQDLLDAIEDIQDAKPATVERAIERLAASNALKLVPYSGALRGGTTAFEALSTGADVEVKEAWDFWDKMQAGFPSINGSLPPKRDYLGRPITRHNSEWFAINPFATSPESTDVLDRELARLAFDFQILPKSIDEGKVQLNAAQYSEFKRLIGQEPMFGGKNLEQTLRELVQSPEYAAMPTDAMKASIVAELYSTARSVAESLLKEQNNGELRNAGITAEVRGIERLTGQSISGISFPTGQ
jgi:predicted GNAT family acetyltransferase